MKDDQYMRDVKKQAEDIDLLIGLISLLIFVYLLSVFI